jgi:hypothetical protein
MGVCNFQCAGGRVAVLGVRVLKERREKGFWRGGAYCGQSEIIGG